MSNIVVPQLGESVVEARVAKWLKKEGDRVETGEPVVELETEKIDLEVGADHGGVITSIKRREGEDVKVGDLLAVVEDGAAASQAQPAASNAPAAPAPVPQPAAEEPRATPTARRMAKEHDVNLGALQGSGSAGRVTKQDVQGALAPTAPKSEGSVAPASQPRTEPTAKAPTAPAGPADGRAEERVRMTKRRATIARRLVEAQHTAAMLTTFNEVDMTGVMGLRGRHKESFQKQYGVGLGISSFFVKATVAALRDFPQLNAEIQGDEIVLKRYYDIGVAVGAEGGLVVPVLRDADRMSFSQIELAIRDFAKRAANGTLGLDDLKGGTFTITNGGVFGSLLSTPIINPPQVGILGLHKIQDRAVPVDGQVAIRQMMYVALTYDHRIVDGREAVQFLVKVKNYIEDPGYLMLES
jgi:2-oxoglutarate dehydrogenase E2 component (dihydrolipoamide succinyltransferase)